MVRYRVFQMHLRQCPESMEGAIQRGLIAGGERTENENGAISSLGSPLADDGAPYIARHVDLLLL